MNDTIPARDLGEFDREREAARAKVVREALLALHKDTMGTKARHFGVVSLNLSYAPDAVLAKLGRMLR